MERKPNVLFLVVDSLRFDAVDSDSFETPRIEELREDSVYFTNCYSQGISTAPSMASMLTGRYPLEYGGHWYIEENQPTFAEEFQRNGYTTAAIHSNPNVSRLRNFDKGFDVFEENILPIEPGGVVEHAPRKLLTLANKLVRVLRKTPYLPAEKINSDMSRWIDGCGEPWFLWTQYMDVHGPYLPGGDVSYRSKFRAEKLWRKAAVNSPENVTEEEHRELWRNYGREVEYLDGEIGRFLDELRGRGDLEDTVVVLTSDHGDEFGEHGRYGHKNLPYDELTHVPLVISFPDDEYGGSVIEEPVRSIDVLPSVLDYAGAELSGEMEERLEGESFLPLLRGGEGYRDSSGPLLTEKEMRGDQYLRIGFRTGKWKYLYDGKNDRELLFDLEKDPGEQEDVFDSYPDVAEWFGALLEKRFKLIRRTSEDVDVPKVEDSPEVEERLKALGYK